MTALHGLKLIILVSPDNSVDNSVIYQNPYWPTEIDGTAIE